MKIMAAQHCQLIFADLAEHSVKLLEQRVQLQKDSEISLTSTQ